MYEKNGFNLPSRPFLVPGNGGGISFDCFLGQRVDWNKVIAVAHTHPYYRGNRGLNFANKYFSGGDPSIVMIKQVPLFLRTPKGKQLKVLEIRNNWLTTREISLTKTHKAKKWKIGN